MSRTTRVTFLVVDVIYVLALVSAVAFSFAVSGQGCEPVEGRPLVPEPAP